MTEHAVIVIPARMASTRFPNKPLALIHNRTMIERVWRIAKAVPEAREVLIATDDENLRKFAESFGAQVIMTSPACVTGTDRVAEVAKSLDQTYSIFFSLQGDAVLTPPWVVEAVLNAMLVDPTVQMATPAVRLTEKTLADFVFSKKEGSTTGTCVVFDKNKNALYFSKNLIPYYRGENTPVYRHIGLYGYRRQTLEQLSRWEEGVLEKSEKLEQLRALENGTPIRVVPVDYLGRTHGSVDRPEDVLFVERIIEKEGELLPCFA